MGGASGGDGWTDRERRGEMGEEKSEGEERVKVSEERLGNTTN